MSEIERIDLCAGMEPRVIIRVTNDDGVLQDWITAPDVIVDKGHEAYDQEIWTLVIPAPNATNASHEPAVMLRMIVCDVKLARMSQKEILFRGRIEGSPGPGTRLRAPTPGWNQCDGATLCQGCPGQPHVIVKDSLWLPPANQTLGDKVRGRHLEIQVKRTSK